MRSKRVIVKEMLRQNEEDREGRYQGEPSTGRFPRMLEMTCAVVNVLVGPAGTGYPVSDAGTNYSMVRTLLPHVPEQGCGKTSHENVTSESRVLSYDICVQWCDVKSHDQALKAEDEN